jgi:hypothetical protein
MRAKRFSQFIRESWDSESWSSETTAGHTRFWFSEESDMAEVLGVGIWQVKIDDPDLDLGLKVLKSLSGILGTELHPVIQSRGVHYSVIWFRPARELEPRELRGAEDRLETLWRDKYLHPDIFLSNATGVSQLVNMTGEWLTTDQLVAIVGWLESKVDDTDSFRRDKLDPEFLAQLIATIKKLGNWPEDLTDWALGDW